MKLDNVLHIRISSEHKEAFAELVKSSGLTQSEFFRECILKNKTRVMARKVIPVDYKRMLYFYNSTSNNMNQLTHKINKASQDGTITQAHFLKLLNALIDIRELLRSGAEQCKPQ